MRYLLLLILLLSPVMALDISEDSSVTGVNMNGDSTIDTFLGLTDTPSSYAGAAGDCVTVNGAEDALIFNSTACSGAGGGGDGFLTDQINNNLNTTANVTFYNMTVEGFLNASGIITHEGQHTLHFHSENDDAILEFDDVGGNNYVGIATSGGFFQLYANPNPSNDYLLATISETQGADTEINFYEGGTNHNRFWDSGSMRIGGHKSYLCANMTDFVDCDTPATGADLVVEDDIFVGGVFIGNTTASWSNVSITKSQVSDYNSTGLILNWSNIISGSGSGDTHEHDQDLNTTDAVSFVNVTIDGAIHDSATNSRIELDNGVWMVYG